MTTDEPTNAPRPAATTAAGSNTATDETPTVRPPQRQAPSLSFTRYLAPAEDYFANRLWTEYKRHVLTVAKEGKQ